MEPRGLFEALQKHLAFDSGRGCALLFCDVDDPKAVNDEYGHANGDQFLVQVAARLMKCTADSDLVCRFGGDEFVVLYPGLGESKVTALASRVQARMRAPLDVGTVRLPLSVSVGSATGRPGGDPDQVLALANRSVYRRKRSRTQPEEGATVRPGQRQARMARAGPQLPVASGS